MPDGHPALPPGEWWACERPEAAPAGLVTFFHACAPCRIAFAVAVLERPRMVQVNDGTAIGLTVGRHQGRAVVNALLATYGDEAVRAVVGIH